MIKIALIAAALAAAQYQYPSTTPTEAPSPSVQGFDPAPVVSIYRKCFDDAEKKTRGATAEVRSREFHACQNAHNAIVDHVAAKLNKADADQARRALDRAFRDVEKRYAKRMGVEWQSK